MSTNNDPGNPIYTGHLPHLQRRFAAGRSGTARDKRLGRAMLARLAAAHDGTRDGVLIHVPWSEWEGYCRVVNDQTGG